MQNKNIINFSENDNFENLVLKSDIPVIVDFYADWCGPCRQIGPELEKACENYKTFKLVKINIDNFSEITDKYNVNSIPHVILFCCGEQEMSFSGFDKGAFDIMVQKCRETCSHKSKNDSNLRQAASNKKTLLEQ